MDKPICRWCGEPLRKDKSTWRHVESDNGRCEVLRRRATGDARTPIEAA